jgi:hypothetical protein
MKLNKELAKEAKEKGICEEWYKILRRTEDKHALIKMFLNGIDFCISKDFPSPRLFQSVDGIRQQYGIFINEFVQTENSKYVVALRRCTGSANYNGFSVGQIFVKHESKLSIKATDNVFIMIDIFDDSEIEVNASGNSKICINQYGGHIETVTDLNAVVKVIHKQSKVY